MNIKIKKSDEKANGNNGIKAEGKKKRGRKRVERGREQRKQQNFSDLLLDMHKNIDFF